MGRSFHMRNASTREYYHGSIKLEIDLPFTYHVLLKLLNLLAEKEATIKSEVTDCQQEIRVLPHNGGKDNYFWKP